jgi:Flp pilus assembly protein TadB
MSKARALARVQRQAAAAQRAQFDQQRRAEAEAARAKRQRRSLRWRHLRLWQHGPGFHRERWGALGTLVLVLLVVTYLFAASITAVVLVGLVLLIVMPALVMLFFERK